MAYVRTHGNQLAIVQGERDPQTGKVQQRVLFSLYSRPEALAALGRGEDRAWNLRGLLESRHPGVRFDWKRIESGIEERLEHLPESYAYRTGEVLGQFRQELCAFTRQLEHADPQSMFSAAELLREQRYELEYLQGLIESPLRLCEQDEREWNRDNRFFWRHRIQANEVSVEVMEKLDDLYERGEYDRLESLAQFFIECFDDYADGHRYLGLVAMERGEHQQAIGHFERTMEVGRRRFPKRMAKKWYWSDHKTRPYMRGMYGKTTALLRSGSVDQALELCDRLVSECGDEDTATVFRSHIFLVQRRWADALEQARRLASLWPQHSFIAAFACYELGQHDDARAWCLHGLLNKPHAGHLLLDLRHRQPRDMSEARDHDAGVELSRDLAVYLAGWRPAVRRFFRGIVRHRETKRLLAEKHQVTERRRDERGTDDRSAYNRMTLMGTLEFARDAAGRLQDGEG